MIRFSLFKSRQPKAFDYYPRYYDAQKEDLDKRIRRVKAEVGLKGENGEDIRQEISFRKSSDRSWRSANYKKQAFKSNIRLIVILIGLCIISYYIFMRLDIFVGKF